jgi:16S rRNA (cytosine967-C5)-methyltransferase
MPISPARAVAFDVLLRVEKTDAYASELLHSSRAAGLSHQDHGLATELVMGVLRWRSILDRSIAKYVTPPLARLDLEVLIALRLGAYQLLFLDRIPRHAAVNESVQLVKLARKRSASGIVNAVLRKITPGNDARHSGRAANQLATTEELAHPAWLVERWKQNFGPNHVSRICRYDQTSPATTIRATCPGLIEELRRDGITLRPGELVAKAFFITAGELTKTKAFRELRLAIQDEASQLVAMLVGRGKAILDCCAAPGGKTRLLAERNPDADIVALELHPHRAFLLRKLAPNSNIKVIAADARRIPLVKNFARVLVDAPCSGTGTLARHPEIKWRLKPEDLPRLQAYQSEILRSAMAHVASGGRIIYSTCSLEPEENSKIVESAVAANHAFHVIDCRQELQRLKAERELVIDDIETLLSGPYLRTIPGVHQCDGFFAAILERS